MQRWLHLGVLGVVLSVQSGCALPIYNGDPVWRARQLVYTSENLRQMHNTWERIWFLDQPSTMTPGPVHGGVISDGGPLPLQAGGVPGNPTGVGP